MNGAPMVSLIPRMNLWVGHPPYDSMHAIGREVRRVQRAPVEDYLHNLRIGSNCLRRVFPQEKQIGSLAHFNRSNVPVEVECLGV